MMQKLLKSLFAFGLAACLALSSVGTPAAAADVLYPPAPPVEAVEIGEGALSAPALFSLEDSDRLGNTGDITGGEFTVQYPESAKDSGANSYSRSVRAAALPDLQLSALRTETAQPLANCANIHFTFTVTNRGTAAVSAMYFSIYVDSAKIMVNRATGTLAPGETAVCGFYLSNKSGGTHVVKAVVNEDRSTAESNYTNNTAQASIRWADCISLVARSFYGPDGKTSFASNAYRDFRFRVSNRGTLDAHSVPYWIELDGKSIYGGTLTNLPARTTIEGKISIKFNKKGKARLGVRVDPEKAVADVDRTDNLATNNFTITFDTEIVQPQWRSAKDIPIHILKSALDVHSDASVEVCATNFGNAAIIWNGQKENVSFGKVTAYPNSNAHRPGVNIEAEAIRKEDNLVKTIAVTSYYKKFPDGSYTYIEPDQEGTVELAIVTLNPDAYPNISHSVQMRSVSHEFGHVLGLDEATCGDEAVMHQTADGALAAAIITPHDRYQLDQIY